MFVVFLGTGNALPSVERANTSLAIMAARGAQATLIDCGGDPYRALLRAGIGAARVDAIIITHAHIDHIGGFPSLIESWRIAGRTSPVHVYGNEHVLTVLRGLMGVFAFELTMDHWPFTITYHLIAPSDVFTAGQFTWTACETEHSIASLGLRMVQIGQDAPLVGYTSDTQYTPQLAAIAQDATLFIAEATYGAGYEDDAQFVRHMTVPQAAAVAEASHVGALALVHLSMPPTHMRAIRHDAASVYKGQLIVPHDGMIVEITGTTKSRVFPRMTGRALS